MLGAGPAWLGPLAWQKAYFAGIIFPALMESTLTLRSFAIAGDGENVQAHAAARSPVATSVVAVEFFTAVLP
jgi:hypothetical protein